MADRQPVQATTDHAGGLRLIEAAALIVAEVERTDRAYDRLSAAEG